MATAISALIHLITIWKRRNISLHTKIQLYKSLIMYRLLYGCITWTLPGRLERRITAFENKAYRRILEITYREIKTNDYVCHIIIECIGQVEHLLLTVKRMKCSYVGHTMRHASLNKTVLKRVGLQGCVVGKRRGRPRKNWMDNIVEWVGSEMDLSQLLEATRNSNKWRRTCVAAIHINPMINRSRD